MGANAGTCLLLLLVLAALGVLRVDQLYRHQLLHTQIDSLRTERQKLDLHLSLLMLEKQVLLSPVGLQRASGEKLSPAERENPMRRLSVRLDQAAVAPMAVAATTEIEEER